jgi:hypothetical protein
VTNAPEESKIDFHWLDGLLLAFIAAFIVCFFSALSASEKVEGMIFNLNVGLIWAMGQSSNFSLRHKPWWKSGFLWWAFFQVLLIGGLIWGYSRDVLDFAPGAMVQYAVMLSLYAIGVALILWTTWRNSTHKPLDE